MTSSARQSVPLFEPYRAYLRLIGGLMLDRRLQSKVDLSGIVQTTMLEMLPFEERFSICPEGDRLAWLRMAFSNNLMDETRRFRAAKRNIQNERSLEIMLEESSARVARWLVLDQSTPSQKIVRDEQLLELARCLAQLPSDQARAVELHYLQGNSLAETSEAMGRSFQSAAGLVYRGVKRLRELMSDE